MCNFSLQGCQMTIFWVTLTQSKDKSAGDTLYFYASVPEAAVAGGIMFLGCPFVPFFWTQYVRNAWGSFFEFGTNVHLDSTMNW